jgi:Xaa-Pro aminopeptidase
MNIFPSGLARTALVALFLASGLTRAPGDDGAPTSATASIVAGPTKDEYKARRKSLMEKLKAAEAGEVRRAPRIVVVLVGEGEEADHNRFRQENDFYYLTGIEQPHAAVILRPDTGEETLYLPPRDRAQDRWVGARLGPGKESAEATGFDLVESTGAFLGDLFRLIGDPRTGGRGSTAGVVYLLNPGPTPGDSTPATRLSRFVREGAPSARFKDLAPIAHEMRKAKSDAETALIRRAVAVTADAHREVIRLIRPGVPEYRLEGAIVGAFVAGGASRAGFASIVGSGPNSTIGGEYKGYTADLTRTYPANGRYTPRQREIYQLVLDAQSAAAAEFKPGVSTMGALNRTVREFFKNSPIRAKDAEGREQTMDHFFAHGLGHQLGLDVHDVGDNSKPLQPGEVFTIEPGLYIPGESLGVRIEDDYRATKDGLEKLSKEIPVEVEEIERLIKKARGGLEVATPASVSSP